MQITELRAVRRYSGSLLEKPTGVMMKTNIGGLDRGIRIVVGLVLLSLIFLLEGVSRWWGLIGVVLLATGLIGWCPAYLPFGINTSKKT